MNENDTNKQPTFGYEVVIRESPTFTFHPVLPTPEDAEEMVVLQYQSTKAVDQATDWVVLRVTELFRRGTYKTTDSRLRLYMEFKMFFVHNTNVQRHVSELSNNPKFHDNLSAIFKEKGWDEVLITTNTLSLKLELIKVKKETK